MTLQFDAPYFTAIVSTLAQTAFQDILSQIGDEHLYAFGLYTNGEGSYVLPTSNTEEALDRKATASAAGNTALLTLHHQSLRWSPCDWQYHEVGGDAAVEQVAQYLEQGWNANYTDYLFDPEVIEMCCIEALRQLQCDRFFTLPENQSPVLVNVFKGDQSDEELIAFAQQLNDETLCTQFQQELDRGYEAFCAIGAARRESQK